MSRSQARETALQALFQLDLNHGQEGEAAMYESLALDTAVSEAQGELTEQDTAYLTAAVRGTRRQLAAIDELIAAAAKGWRLERMATVDRNVLRLAVYEMRFGEEQLKKGIAINEAVNLAKKYGTDDSGRVVNGILSTIAR